MSTSNTAGQKIFLLTPLREGRLAGGSFVQAKYTISTHAPAGGATFGMVKAAWKNLVFLLTPLREGRLGLENRVGSPEKLFLLTPLREGRRPQRRRRI